MRYLKSKSKKLVGKNPLPKFLRNSAFFIESLAILTESLFLEVKNYDN